MLALSRARAGSCGLRCIACPSVRRSVLTSSLAMAAALRFAVLICLLCSCAVQPALAPSLSQDRPTERAAREGCATTRDGRGCAAAEAAAHHPRAGRTGMLALELLFRLCSLCLRFFETSSVRPAPRPRRGPPRPRHAAPLPTRDAGVPDILQLAAGGSIRARTRVAGAARRDGRLTAAACRSHGSPVTPLFLIGSIN